MPGVISRRQAKPVPANIANFTRVSKVQNIGKGVLAKAACIEVGKLSSIEVVLPSRKRKAVPSGPSPESSPLGPSKRQRQDVFQVPTPPQAPIFASIKKRRAATTTTATEDKENTAPTPRQLAPPAKLALSPSTPAKKAQKRRRASDAAEAGAEPSDLLERLALSSPAQTRKRSRVVGAVEQLPQELVDLLGLHASLLKALTLHYAHNGSNSPVDIEAICPNVSQSWGKRRVVSEDIQRCIGMSAWRSEKGKAVPIPSPFLLCEYKRAGGAALATSYARGKLCIELTEEAAASGRLDEERLNRNFEENLRTLWSTRRDSNLNSFVGGLPKAPVTARSAAVPLLVRGQVAREQIEKDVAQRQREREAKAAAAAAAPALNADGTKTSLLDRIRQKELRQSLAGPAPTPAQQRRRAALQRAEDVAGIVGMLSTATAEGRARISFTMPALLVRLRDSLRVPVSAEDGACCVRLLAAEVAPEWLRIVTVGGKENVVVQTGLQPAKTEVQARVTRLLA